MNKQQIDYATGRVDSIVKRKGDAYRAAMPAPPKLTATQKMELIRSGKANLREDAYYRTYLTDAFDYPDPNAKKREAALRDLDKFEQRIAAEGAKLKDRIILLDGLDAAKLIEEFAAKEHK